mgnify:CR=1 FL=1
MYVKKMREDFPLNCIGRTFKCIDTSVTFYHVNHIYKIHPYEYDKNCLVLEDLTLGKMTSWNGISAEFVEVMQEEQLCFNFS